MPDHHPALMASAKHYCVFYLLLKDTASTPTATRGSFFCGSRIAIKIRRATLLGEMQSMGFRVLVVGGTGQVGSALVRALLAASSCTEVVMVNRRTIPLAADARLRQVIMDTSAPNFPSKIAEVARACSVQGDPLYAASCIGIGKGSQQWSEEDIKKLEIGLVGAFARGCLAAGVERFGLLSAAGSSAKSWIRYARIMGEKEDAVRSLGFRRLAIFRPGIIAGNVHTPGFLALLGRFVPGSFGTISVGPLSVNFFMGKTARRSWKMPR
jgi:NAD dependent epimerase/dehydratase family